MAPSDPAFVGARRHAEALPASERLYRLQSARASQMERLRAEAATAELAGCSFAPQLHERKARCLDHAAGLAFSHVLTPRRRADWEFGPCARVPAASGSALMVAACTPQREEGGEGAHAPATGGGDERA